MVWVHRGKRNRLFLSVRVPQDCVCSEICSTSTPPWPSREDGNTSSFPHQFFNQLAFLEHMAHSWASKVASGQEGVGGPAAYVFAILHGAGNGILTIAKGTLPLVLFGPAGYGARQGLMMVPARVAQAFAPVLFGMLLDSAGAAALWLTTLLGLAALGALWLLRPMARA